METIPPIQWLQGIRVVLIGNYVPAPYAAYLLRGLGAEVVKVEQGAGDHLRHLGDLLAPAMSPMFRMLNAGFKSIGLQWRQPAGAALLGELLATAHVLIDGSRKGVLEQALGSTVETIAPHIIYVPISAYGQTGPMAHLGGHDNNVLALAGNLSFTDQNPAGNPTLFSAPVADLLAGQLAALGALAAWIGRQQRHPGPYRLDASMLHAAFSLNALEVAALNLPGTQPPQAGKAWMNGARPDYRPYLTRDGKHIFFGLIEPWALKRFLQTMDKGELLQFEGNPELFAHHLQAMFLEKDQTDWVGLGVLHDACITPVQDLGSAMKDPQICALGLVHTVHDPVLGALDLPGFPLGFGRESKQPALPASAPRLGEHTREILMQELHQTATMVTALEAQQVIRCG